MLQKKALAMAIATALPIAASAATITTGGHTFTNEARQVDNFLLDGSVNWAPAIETAPGNKVVFTFSSTPVNAVGGTFSFPSLIQCDGEAVDALELVSQVDGVITYEVIDAIAADEVCIIGDGFDIATNTVGDDEDVTVSSVTTNRADVSIGDDGLDAEDNPFVVFENLGDHFTAALSDLGATIDVEAETPQAAFADATGDAGTTATFTLTFTVNDAAHVADPATQVEALGDFQITLSNGDFSWLDTDGDTSEGIVTEGISIASGFDIAGDEIDVSAIDDGIITISFTRDGAIATDDTIVVSLAGPADGVAIPEQDISVAITAAAEGDADVNLLSVNGTDSYTSNGSTVSVYAVPTSESVSNFIWVSNTSTSSGEVSVTVVDDGNTYGPYSLGQIGAGSVFDVGSRFKTEVEAAGEELSGRRVRLDIITELPERNVAVSAAYRSIAADDRITLLTSNESEHDNAE